MVYVAAEGAGGFRKRIKAYQHAHGADLRGALSVLPSVISLLTDDDKALAQAILDDGGAAVVVIDTLAQVTPGGNEKSGEDMGQAIARCKRLHAATGALVVLVHHVGKDTTGGARGWSGIRAAMDAEIEITRTADVRTASMRKQKDGDGGGAFNFKLRQLVVGIDDDDEEVTSCVVEYVAGITSALARKALDVNQRIVFEIATDAIGLSRGIGVGGLLTACKSRMSHDPQKRDKRREPAKRALDGLVSMGVLTHEDGCVALPHPPTAPFDPFGALGQGQRSNNRGERAEIQTFRKTTHERQQNARSAIRLAGRSAPRPPRAAGRRSPAHAVPDEGADRSDARLVQGGIAQGRCRVWRAAPRRSIATPTASRHTVLTIWPRTSARRSSKGWRRWIGSTMNARRSACRRSNSRPSIKSCTRCSDGSRRG